MNIKEKTSSFFKVSVTVDKGVDLGRNYKISNPVLFNTSTLNIFKVENKFTDDDFTVEYVPLKKSTLHKEPYDFYLKIINNKNSKDNCLCYFFEINDKLIYIQYNFIDDKYYLCHDLKPINRDLFESFFAPTRDKKKKISEAKELLKLFIFEIEHFLKVATHRDSTLTAQNDPLYYVDFIFSDKPIRTWEEFYAKYGK